MYSPKISDELIPALYHKAKEYQIRMTTLVDILIKEGMQNADVAFALQFRKESKKVKDCFKDKRPSSPASGENLHPGLRTSLSSPQPIQYDDSG